MTRQEFIKLAKADLRTQYFQIGALWVVFVLFSAAGAFLLKRWENEISNHSSVHLGMLAGLAAGFCVVAILTLRRSSKKLLKCPHCRKPLGGFPSQVVVASSNCGHCGQRIIDEG